MRIFTVLIICLLATQSQAAVTFKDGKISSGSNGGLNTLLKDLVTQEREASSLSDKELCDSLTMLDLPSTFYEHEKRGLDCLTIRIPQENWKLPSRDQAFKYLKKYQSKYKVVVPKYSFDGVGPVFGSPDKTAELYKILNPSFSDLGFNQGIDSEQVEDRMSFCLDWFGNVSYVTNGQSKGLDGSVSWKEETLRDGFVICQGTFNDIYLRSLIDQSIRPKLEKMLLSWINNDRLRHDAETTEDIFLPVLLFNKASTAIEMFHESFEWNNEQEAKLSTWLERRALEMFPSDVKPLAGKCPTNQKSSSFHSYEACQNGGILRAQALLRVGIWNKDPEFVEMAYVAFHRYMSGIRKDGSNIADARRGCTAADYNIWASQFMSDFLFHWDRISDPLWDKTFHNIATPNKSVEYSLSLFGNFEAINKHTLKKKWNGCGEDKKNKTQQATTQYGESYYPRISFAPYFENKNQLLDALLDYDRLTESAYSAQSGANYEISFLAKYPGMQSEVKAKIKDRLLAKMSANVPQAIKRLGIGQNIKGEFITMDSSSINLEGPKLTDYRPPKEAGKSARFKVKYLTLESPDVNLNRKTITFYKRSNSLLVGIWMEDLFKYDGVLAADWKPIYEKCGKIADEDTEVFWFEVPVKTNWSEMNEQFRCFAENTNSTKIEQLIRLLIYAANNTDLEMLRP